ncbi:MAG: DJ-1/PfpI family protein [Campylobacteraceae bacterium]|jgi:4-methyl-5(b-hydroxyethyl)-thiazole monophosphate biosynthesis|nr:DJ-1/PfpI family protein [Campylobacteraceae bacterium]
MSRVLVPLADGFEEIEAIAVIDVLRRGGVEVVTASLLEQSAKGANNVVVTADTLLEDVKESDFDMIVLPGGNEGHKNLAKSAKLLDMLRAHEKAGKTLAAICAAPYVLKTAGVLKGEYTCYPSMEHAIGMGGGLSYTADKKVVANSENIITSQGPATAIDFALFILEKLEGKVKAASIRQAVLTYSPPRISPLKRT